MIARIDPRIKAADLVEALRTIGCRVIATRDGGFGIVKDEPITKGAANERRTEPTC